MTFWFWGKGTPGISEDEVCGFGDQQGLLFFSAHVSVVGRQVILVPRVLTNWSDNCGGCMLPAVFCGIAGYSYWYLLYPSPASLWWRSTVLRNRIWASLH